MGSFEYNGEHSITIGKNLLVDGSSSRKAKNTWYDWYLIPATRPVVNPPAPAINMISIPGTDGALDITDVLSGRATYGNRSGSWVFYVDNDHGKWSNRYSEIMKYLQGKRYEVMLNDDPIYYYEGRLAVNEWRSDASHSSIVINYNLEPYKKYKDFGDNYLWDPLYFGNHRVPTDKGDHIQSYRNIKVEAEDTRIIDVVNYYESSDVRINVNNNGSSYSKAKLEIVDEHNQSVGEANYLSTGISTLDLNLSEGTYKFKITNNNQATYVTVLDDQEQPTLVQLSVGYIKVSIYLTGGLL